MDKKLTGVRFLSVFNDVNGLMITRILSSILLMVLSATSVAEEAGMVMVSDFSVRGIFITSEPSEILETIESNAIKYAGIQEQTGLDSWNIDDNGLRIYIDERTILNLQCTTNCATNVGLKIGDSSEEVIRAFGTPKAIGSDYVKYQFCGKDYCADAFLYFYFLENRLEKIEYWVAYV